MPLGVAQVAWWDGGVRAQVSLVKGEPDEVVTSGVALAAERRRAPLGSSATNQGLSVHLQGTTRGCPVHIGPTDPSITALPSFSSPLVSHPLFPLVDKRHADDA